MNFFVEKKLFETIVEKKYTRLESGRDRCIGLESGRDRCIGLESGRDRWIGLMK